MKKAVIIIPAAAVGVAALVLIIWLLAFPKPDYQAYEKLAEPRITGLPAQKMLVVTVKGAPEQSLPPAFGVLYQVYYSLAETTKAGPPPAPRLRCAVPVYCGRPEYAPHRGFHRRNRPAPAGRGAGPALRLSRGRTGAGHRRMGIRGDGRDPPPRRL